MSRKKVCLVTSEIVGPFRNGGIGTHCYYLAQFLSEQSDCETTVLYNGAIDQHDVTYWRKFFKERFDVDFVWVRPSEEEAKNACYGPTCLWDQISQRNHDYLKSHPHDLVIFQEMLGGGFRTIQARKALGAGKAGHLVVMVHSSWQWITESMESMPTYGFPEMMTKFMERYSVENCDELVSPSQYMLNWSKTDIPSLPQNSRVLPYLFEEDVQRVASTGSATEVIFFGRLEQRKGLVLLLEALSLIAEGNSPAPHCPIPVYFVGKSGQTVDGDGIATINRFRPALAAMFDLCVIDNLGHQEALDFLRAHPSALVVCPSLQDNSPYAIIENLELGTNLIACATGGIPELFEDMGRLCPPQPEPLAELIRRGMAGTLPAVKAAYSRDFARKAWTTFLADRLGPTPILPEAPSLLDPKFVTLSVEPNDDPGIALGSQHVGTVVLEHGRFGVRAVGSGNSRPVPTTAASEHDGGFGKHGIATHCLLLVKGGALTENAARLLSACVSREPNCIWTGFVEIGGTTPRIYAPLGECPEAALYGNVFGCCVAVFPWPALLELNPDQLMLLQYSLHHNGQWWPLLAGLLFSGWKLEVVPEVVATWTGDEPVLEALPQSLALRLAVLRAADPQLPGWAARLLPYFAASATATSLPLQPSNCGSAMFLPSPRSSLGDYIRRSLQRIRRVASATGKQ